MSLAWASILQAVEYSVEIVCESWEDVMKLPEIVIFNIFLPVNMSVAFLDSSIESQKGGCIKLNQTIWSISLNTNFYEWHLVLFRVPILSLFYHISHISSTVNSATDQAEV